MIAFNFIRDKPRLDGEYCVDLTLAGMSLLTVSIIPRFHEAWVMVAGIGISVGWGRR